MQLRPICSTDKIWWGTVLEAHVSHLDTFRGVVFIRADGLGAVLSSWGCTFAKPKVKRQIQAKPYQVQFNVLWQNATGELASAPLGTSIVGGILAQDVAYRTDSISPEPSHAPAPLSMPARILQSWLFPTSEEVAYVEGKDQRASTVDGAGTTAVDVRFRDKRLNPQGYYDDKLNEEQLEAVEYLATTRPLLPFLIDGPPGTGKTKTMCEATLQILLRQPRATVLLMAPSPTAADTLALRLSGTLHPKTLFRLNAPSRSMATLPLELTPYTHVEQSEQASVFGLPPAQELLHKRVVVTTTLDAELLLKARLTNSDLQRLAQHIGPLISARAGPAKDQLHWTHLLVDEAGQGTEAELCTPIAVVLPHPQSQCYPTLALCGDAAQLGPRIQSSDACTMGLDLSLLERLLRRAIYRNALKSLREQQKHSTLGWGGGGGPGVTLRGNFSGMQAKKLVCALRRNYRARHPALITVPSTLWYDDTLVPAAPQSHALQGWKGWPNDRIPIMFENLPDAQDVWVDQGVSWHSMSPLLVLPCARPLSSLSFFQLMKIDDG